MNEIRMTNESAEVISTPQTQAPMPIAVIGMACRLPGEVYNMEQLWELCAHARSAWSPVPESRFQQEAFYHPDPDKKGCTHAQGGHFLSDDLSLFDAPFFKITAQEAKAMDPQQRILLECTYEALENAGLPLHLIAGQPVGVFAAQSFSQYAMRYYQDLEMMGVYTTTGCTDALLSNRVSYTFDLRGPSMTIDTACSSSLTALHVACQSIKARESNMAVVAGCHLLLNADDFVSFSKSGLLSSTGKCMAFDDRATGGYGRGEGAGCIILKPLVDALRDGDTVRAVIRNSGSNQDGRTSGITMPNRDAQTSLIRSVYRAAGLEPLETGFVEAHGTGTAIGDPIEASAIGEVFRRPINTTPLYVGSLKSNIGHLGGTSGVVSIIKVVLMLEKGFILPNCDFKATNPKIPMADWNMKVPSKQVLWPRCKFRRASVNSFGLGGANTHVILEQAPLKRAANSEGNIANGTPANKLITNGQAANGVIKLQYSPAASQIESDRTRASHSDKARYLFVFSAADETSAKVQVASLCQYLKERHEIMYRSLYERLAFTLQRRTQLQWRFALTATCQEKLLERMEETKLRPVRTTRSPRLGFVFTGQGAQWYGMGRELRYAYPVFERAIVKADLILKKLGCPWSLLYELSRDQDSSLIDQADISQAACTAIQLGLVDLLSTFNVRPSCVVGHSSGEIAGAYAAGVLTFDTCILLAYHRGKAVLGLSDRFPKIQGAMLAVGTSPADTDTLLRDFATPGIVIACINSPASVTLSGDEASIATIAEAYRNRGLFNRKLRVNVAYHSHHMDLVAQDYRSKIKDLQMGKSSTVDFFSSLTGDKIDTSKLGADYWVNNMKSPVLFSDAVRKLCHSDGVDILLELGPHCALKGSIRQILGDATFIVPKPEYIHTLVRFENSSAAIMETAANLFLKGCLLNLSAVNFPMEDAKKPALLQDLPTYPWNHSEQYWLESRISRAYQYPQGQRNDLLGIRLPGSNDLEPQWRNVLRVESLPWLLQHKISGNTVFPMSGFIAMAIEAMRSYATTRDLRFSRYSLREVVLNRALIIPYSIDVETMIALRPANEGTRGSSKTWNEIRIFSWTLEQQYSEHYRCLISVDGSHDLMADASFKTGSKRKSIKEWVVENSSKTIISEDMYTMIDRTDLEYGPLFQRLEEVKAGSNPDTAVGSFLAPDTATVMPYQYESDLVIHPVTLDVCFQISWPILSKAGTLAVELHVPTYINKVEIAADFSRSGSNRLSVYGLRAPNSNFSNQQSTSIYIDRHGETGNAFAFEAENFTVTSLGGDSSPPKESALAFTMLWQPHFRLLSSKQFQNLFPQSPLSQKAFDFIAAADKASLVFADRAVRQIQHETISNMQEHHKQLHSWLKSQLIHGTYISRALRDDRAFEILSKCDEEIIDYLRNECGPSGRFLCKIGEALPNIMVGRSNPLTLMMEDDLLGEVYRTEEMGTRQYPQAAQYIGLMAHQNPHLKIIEIGAGTCAATHVILPLIAGQLGNQVRFSKYVCTDISTGFFDGARQLLEPWASLLQFEPLDIEIDPRDQGFAEAEFDLVIASNMLHTTKNMDNTMRNVRRLLKPSGNVLIIEMTVMTLRVFMYGTLPGWWRGEEETRKDAPLLSETQWDNTLKRCGFSGLDLCLPDYNDEVGHISSLMISTAVGHDNGVKCKGVLIITLNQEANQGLVRELKNDLTPVIGSIPMTCTMQEVTRIDLSDIICISLIELETPIFKDLEQIQLEQIQWLCRSNGLLWATRSATVKLSSPDAHLFQGLARSIRNEITSFRLVTLDLDVGASLGSSAQSIIIEVFRLAFLTADPLVEDDMEFMERNGVVCVPRITHDAKVEASLQSYLRKPTPEMQSISQGNRQLVAKQSVEGSLENFYFDDRTQSVEDNLNEYDICIKVKSVGLNFRDVLVALGHVPGAIGNECSGVVTKVGAKVTNIALGDRVCAMARDCIATSVRAPASHAVQIPDSMSFTDAASVLAVFSTAKYCLIDRAQLQPDESVLIHAAAGGVGQAAILIAQMIGAKVFATVGSTEKKNFLVEKYRIPECHIFSSRHLSFGKEVRRATAGKGVDVVLNSLAGDFLRLGWGCLAPFGRFIEIGKRDILQNSFLEMGDFDRSLSFFCVDLLSEAHHRPRQIQRILSGGMELARNRMPMLLPVTVLPFHELEHGFRMLQTAKVIGKIVFELRDDDQVMVMPSKSRPTKVRADATYLLTGGSGGLGCSITKFLVQQGARHIVLASRQGPESAKVQALIEELAGSDANIVPISCDVGDMENVRALVTHCAATMPPIRGVIHGAMVLDDMLFERTNAETYMRIMRPKIHGVWNLHSCLLSHALDFFINLSSAAGIWGSRGQAVYGATSTALGAFARWRTAQNMPTVTIHIGRVSEVGYVAEREDVMEVMRRDIASDPISERSVHALVMTAIEGRAWGPEIYTGFAFERNRSQVYWLRDAKFSTLRRTVAQDTHHAPFTSSATVSLSQLLKTVGSVEAARQLMVEGLLQKVCSLLMLPPEVVDVNKPVAALGLDSLVAVELRNWIAREVEVSINLVEVMTASSLATLAELAGQRSRLVNWKGLGGKE